MTLLGNNSTRVLPNTSSSWELKKSPGCSTSHSSSLVYIFHSCDFSEHPSTFTTGLFLNRATDRRPRPDFRFHAAQLGGSLTPSWISILLCFHADLIYPSDLLLQAASSPLWISPHSHPAQRPTGRISQLRSPTLLISQLNKQRPDVYTSQQSLTNKYSLSTKTQSLLI